MNRLANPPRRSLAAPGGTGFGRQVLAHLDAQLESSRRLLGAVLAQGAAIRRRDVEAVLRRLTEIQTEMNLRGSLDAERADLLVRAAGALGMPPRDVTLEHLTGLMSPLESQLARERSAELSGLLHETAREHACNRALMRQELAFLDHLTRLIGNEPAAGYRPPGHAPAPREEPVPVHRVLNVRA